MSEEAPPLISLLPVTSSLRRVLDTPELLSNILELATPACQVAAAQVCNSWGSNAFRFIWRDMESLIPLLNLLTPVKRKVGGGVSVLFLEYDKDYEPHYWERMRFYGRYVRTIAHDDREKIRIDVTVFQKMAAAALNRSPFFPILRSLEWVITNASSITGIGVMLSSTIEELQLFMNTTADTSTYSKVLGNLVERTRNIKSLAIHLHPDIGVGDIETPLAVLLRDSPALETLKLPPYFLSQKVVTALESHALMTLDQTNVGCRKVRHDSKGCCLFFDGGNFSKLEKLAFNHDLQEAANLFTKPCAPTTLTSLYIGTKRLCSRSDLRIFLGILVDCNPSIQEVNLNLYAEEDAGAVEQITFQEVAPLLRADLISFNIAHNHPLMYSVADVHAMSKSWPNIMLLYLNDEVVIQDSSHPPQGQDLSILNLFTSFSMLSSLGIYFTVEESFRALDSLGGTRFNSLRTLTVGTSVLPKEKGPNAKEIGLYLASLVSSEDFEISLSHSDWYPKRASDNDRNSSWDEACDYLSVCMMAQKGLRRDLEEREQEACKQRDLIRSLKDREQELLKEIGMLRQRVEPFRQ
ncbi:hypothetical protein FRC03_001556 [Tulasnella sp. 419]|nr:hypothetical protein FRC03_001556 [Tulasnella sp. 419]